MARAKTLGELLKEYSGLFSLVLIVLLSTPSVRDIFEKYMITHMLVQLPLLAVLGAIIGNYLATYYIRTIPYYYALPLLFIAIFSTLFWMLPRTLDASLDHTIFMITKFLMLPFLLGVPLVLAWKNIGVITKAFFIVNLLSMLMVLGWLYIEAPVRLCNYYLINEQQIVGQALLYIAMFILLWWTLKVFVGNTRHKSSYNESGNR